MIQNNEPISSLIDFIKRTLHIRELWESQDEEYNQRSDQKRSPLQPWFRGVSSEKSDLTPGIYRLQEPDENEIWDGFKRQGLQLLPSELRLPENHISWYFLMQHHGAPTRLLDWTDGALLGLFFALRNHPTVNKDKCQHEIDNAAVWMLDPVWLNRKTFKDSHTEGVLIYDWPEVEPWFPEPFSEALHVHFPAAVDPPHIAKRLAVQHSRFTVHGLEPNGIEKIATDNPSDRRLEKLVIEKGKVREIVKDLSTCGIVETTIFPDLEGLARQLKWEWSES